MMSAKETLARYKGKFHDSELAKAIDEGRVNDAVQRASTLAKQGSDSVGYARILSAESGSGEPLTEREQDMILAGAFVGVMRLFSLEARSPRGGKPQLYCL
jgi:hypothetical protein